MFQLRIAVPQESVRVLTLDASGYTVGRSGKADISIQDPSASRLHARLILGDGGAIHVEDLGSHFGTFVNGRRVNERATLKKGDRVSLGNTTLTLEDASTTKVVVEDEDTAADSLKFFSSDKLVPQRSADVPSAGALLQRRSQVLEILYEVSKELLHERKPEELFQLIVDRLFDFLQADRGVILVREAGGELREVVSRFADGVEPSDLYLSRTVVEAVLGEKRGALYVATPDQVAAPVVAESLQLHGISSCLAAPLYADDEVMGMVYLDVKLRRRAFDEEDLRLATALANSAAIKLRTARLQEERRRGEELRLARDAAEEANQKKSDFLARMSHELRTPLNAILGYAEILQDELAERDFGELVPDVQKVSAAGRHLLVLINDVLDLSKIEAGKMTIGRETFPVAGAVEEVSSMVVPLVERNRNALTVEGLEEIGSMDGDPTRVKQILFNLLSNAAKFTNEGSITVSCHRDAANGLARITFLVADTGIGMSAEQLSRIFQPFSQADPQTSKKYGGTGLGLAISRRLCEMMGGEISVESEPGKGTTFRVDLPAQPPTDATGTGDVAAVAPASSS